MSKLEVPSECTDECVDSRVFLMAEDNPADAELVKEMLDQAFHDKYSIVCVDRFDKIKKALTKGKFEALILDMNLPDRSGVDNVSQLGHHYPDLPIVVLTGQNDLNLAVEALKRGAQDYLTKNNVSPEILSRSLRYAQERKQIELKLRKALKESAFRNTQLEELARHDPLTSLPNRAYFESAALRIVRRAQRAKKHTALLYFDLDNFKRVNDSFGHSSGDELLRQVAQRLKHTVRDSDFIARMGGDEFILITDLLENKREVYTLVNRLLKTFERPFTIGPHNVSSAVSIGVSFFPEAPSIDLLVKQADHAMYEAKVKRHVPVCFFTPQMESLYARNIEIESQVKTALENHEFEVHFQPIRGLKNPEEIVVEALLRWRSSKLGNISPLEFIPIVENGPAIDELTKTVLLNSRKLIKHFESVGKEVGKIKINVTASQLSSTSFCHYFIDWLQEMSIPADMICLELTEREMIKNASQCNEHAKELRSFGIQIALDDFGTGFSSITHLLELPIDYLKLDRLLTDHIDQTPRNQALTAGIVEMAHRLDMQVVAEGIERKEEYDLVTQLGCDYVQGYYIARPSPVEELLCSYSLIYSADHTNGFNKSNNHL